MADEAPVTNTLELPAIVRPWINLVHTVGLPWVIIGLSVWFGVPFAKEMIENSREVAVGVRTLGTKMDESADILHDMRSINLRAAEVNHQDLRKAVGAKAGSILEDESQ